MIIGFTGKLGSGKDTAGARLARLVNLETVRLSFAAPLKESAAALLDIDPIDWETYKNDPEVKIHLTVGFRETPTYVASDWDADGNPIVFEVEEPNVIRTFTAREFLQRYGTESHRDVFGGDFWVEQAMRNYHRTPDTLYYVTDVRFANEAAAVRGLGGVIIRVLGENEETGTHASEAGVPDKYITFEIDNSIRDDGYANLEQQLQSILQTLGIPQRDAAFGVAG